MLLFTTQCKERTMCGFRKYHPRAGGRPVRHRSGDEGRRREARSGRTPPGEAAEGPGSIAEGGGEEAREGQRQLPSRKRCKEKSTTPLKRKEEFRGQKGTARAAVRQRSFQQPEEKAERAHGPLQGHFTPQAWGAASCSQHLRLRR